LTVVNRAHAMMKISPADMLLFVDVVREAGFSAAARASGISKQAVSERINNLESALGVRLLQRTTRSLRVTEAGALYFEECAEIAQRIEQANSTAQAAQATPTGRLTISAPLLYGRDRLMNCIQAFVERYPAVQVNLKLTNSLVNLVDDRVDVALRVSHLNDSSLSARSLGEVSAYFVASPELLQRFETVSPLNIIRSAPAVSFRDGEIWDLPDGSKVKPKTALIVNDLDSLAAAVTRGIGIARMPGILCNPLIEKDRLRKLLGESAATSMTVYAVYVSKKQLAPKIRAFVDVLIEHKADLT
jgi:DNA-binding transcriptional LysR family regulator